MSKTAKSKRDDRIDFLRGLALLVIFIDHVPKNWFEPFTLHSVAFCDAAEVFFFISGFVASLVYGRVMARNGFVAAAKKVWRRAGVVYMAQLGLMLVILAMVRLFIDMTGDETYRWVFRVQWVYEAPLAYIWPVLTMHFQPGYLDILPAYVLLLAAFPLVLKGLEKNIWLVLVPSFLLWLSVQVFGLTLWTTDGSRWFFNPFAWQFLFVLGALFGHPARAGKWGFADDKRLYWAALAIVIPVAAIQISETLSVWFWWATSLRPHTMLLDKTALGPLRLISFFALLIVVRRWLPQPGFFSRIPWTQAVIRCGSASLNVFSLGVLLSSLTAVTAVLSGGNYLVQSVLCVAGVAVQFAYATWRANRLEEAAQSGEGRDLRTLFEPVPARVPPRQS
jgi:Uncharacterized protein conserved in bacteria